MRHLLVVLFICSGCAVPGKINMKKKKAQFIRESGDIVWKKKKYSRDWLTRRYDTEELFKGHKPSQELITEANSYQNYSYLIGASAIYFFFLTDAVSRQFSPNVRGVSLWMLVGLGFIPIMHLQLKSDDAAKGAVEEWNEHAKAPAVTSLQYSWSF